MSEVVKKPLKITETVLRDAHQSLIATRMTTEQMLPIVDKMDKVGYNAVECWGGATFDACLRFLKEDPWDRLRKLRDGFKNTKLQMLFRGQNILGYRPYADDVVEYFVQKSIANGIDIIRIFDCLNDIRNLQTAVTACNKEKGHAQVALSYTLGDAYTLDYWMDMAKRVEDMGADSLCIKDMAGLLVPAKATELVQALKDSTSLPVELHTHYTSGVASMTYMKAVEAGVDIIDTAMSPFALGTSQPATEVMVEAFKGTPYDTGLDLDKLSEIADYFRPMREEALKTGLMNTKVLGVNIQTLRYQVPGGMLSNLISQLKQAGKEDKYYDVLAEIPRVRKDFDYAFSVDKYRGVPEIELREIDPAVPFCVKDKEVIPVSGHHSPRFEVTGFRFGELAYLTDFKTIAPAEERKLYGVEVLVVNALRPQPHDSHFSLDEALALIRRVAPRRAYLTHMSHEMGLYAERSALLPEGVYLAYDGLEINVND